jgi:hypothetical protein
MTCPTCHQPWPGDELVWTVKQFQRRFHVTVNNGRHVGFALRDTEDEARDKALERLNYFEELYPQAAEGT